MNKKGVAKLGDHLSNLASGKMGGFKYKRQPFPQWDVASGEYLLLSNANIIDVNLGEMKEERAILIKDGRIETLVRTSDLRAMRENYPIKKEIDGESLYVIPGLSDIHSHLTLVSEFDLSLRSLRYFDAQRQKNCEEALKAGCTFVRDSGGAFETLSYLKHEIDIGRLLGPRIMPSYQVLTPKGGMWDLGTLPNYLGRMIFGGRLLNYVSSDKEIEQALDRLHEMGCECFKTYFEEKPLYGGKEDMVYNMYTPEQARLLRQLADKHRKTLEAHSMFITGSRRVIDARFDSIAHMTVDEPYGPEDARNMARNRVAIVPTLSLGCYLAMNCGNAGYPRHEDFLFFLDMLETRGLSQIERVAFPELKGNYMSFHKWIREEMPNRKMPGIGQVYPERVHGFAKNAAESFRNFQEAGTMVGVGTDGGTGISFAGHLEIEFEGLQRFGYNAIQILRMTTLGNMEILGRNNEFGSIEKGKYADLVLLGRNPLEGIEALTDVRFVFKNGRLCHVKQDSH